MPVLYRYIVRHNMYVCMCMYVCRLALNKRQVELTDKKRRRDSQSMFGTSSNSSSNGQNKSIDELGQGIPCFFVYMYELVDVCKFELLMYCIVLYCVYKSIYIYVLVNKCMYIYV